MASDIDGKAFMTAPLGERALMLLTHCFRSADDPVSRQNVGQAIAQASARPPGGVAGGTVIGGGGNTTKQALREVTSVEVV